MSFWNSMRSTSGSGGLNPIVQKVPMPSVMPARASTASAVVKPAAPFSAQLAAAAAPAPVAKPVVAPPVATPAPVPVQAPVQVPPPASTLPKASSLDPARLKAALVQAPRAMAPAAPVAVQVPVPSPGVASAKVADGAPMAAVAILRRALVAQARGDHAGAVAEFTAAIALDAKCVEAWTGRGISKEHLGDADGARRDYAKGIEIEVYAEIDRQRRLPPDLVA